MTKTIRYFSAVGMFFSLVAWGCSDISDPLLESASRKAFMAQLDGSSNSEPDGSSNSEPDELSNSEPIAWRSIDHAALVKTFEPRMKIFHNDRSGYPPAVYISSGANKTDSSRGDYSDGTKILPGDPISIAPGKTYYASFSKDGAQKGHSKSIHFSLPEGSPYFSSTEVFDIFFSWSLTGYNGPTEMRPWGAFLWQKDKTIPVKVSVVINNSLRWDSSERVGVYVSHKSSKKERRDDEVFIFNSTGKQSTKTLFINPFRWIILDIFIGPKKNGIGRFLQKDYEYAKGVEIYEMYDPADKNGWANLEPWKLKEIRISLSQIWQNSPAHLRQGSFSAIHLEVYDTHTVPASPN